MNLRTMTTFALIILLSTVLQHTYTVPVLSTQNISYKENYQTYLTNSTLKLSLGWWPDSLNPVSSDSDYDWEILSLIFEKLTGPHPFDMQNISKDIGWLAESWVREILINFNASALLGSNASDYFNDGLPEIRNVSVWHVKLRENVTWQDGTPFTADDVVFTYQFITWLYLGEEDLSKWLHIYKTVLHVNKTGEYSVDIWVKDDSFFGSQSALNMVILPKHVYSKANTWGDYRGEFPKWNVPKEAIIYYKPKKATDPILIGTGPFRLIAWYPDQIEPDLADTFILRRYDDYYFRAVDAKGNEIILWSDSQFPENPAAKIDQHGPYIKELHYIVSLDPVVLYDRIVAGIIDMASDFYLVDYVDKLQNLGFTIKKSYRNGFGYITLNCQGYSSMNITKYAAVRRAIAYAIDKYEIVDKIWKGYAIPIDLPVPSTFGNWSFEKNLKEHYYGSNLSKALQLLNKSGIRDYDGDGWLELYPNKPGEEVELTLVCYYSNLYKQLGDILKENLNAIGIHLKVICPNFSLLWNFWEAGLFDLTFFGCNLNRFPDILRISTSGNYFNKIIFYRWENETYDSYVNKMFTAKKVDEAIKFAQLAQEILYYEQPIIPLYQNIVIGAFRSEQWMGAYNLLGKSIVNFWTIMKTVKVYNKKQNWNLKILDYPKTCLKGQMANITLEMENNSPLYEPNQLGVNVLYWYSGESADLVNVTYIGNSRFVAVIPFPKEGIVYFRPLLIDSNGNRFYGEYGVIYVYDYNVSYIDQTWVYEQVEINLKIKPPFDYNSWIWIEPKEVKIIHNATGEWIENDMEFQWDQAVWRYILNVTDIGDVYFRFKIIGPYGGEALTKFHQINVVEPPLPIIVDVSSSKVVRVNTTTTVSAFIYVPSNLSVKVYLAWWYEGEAIVNKTPMVRDGEVFKVNITPIKPGIINFYIEIIDSKYRVIKSEIYVLKVRNPSIFEEDPQLRKLLTFSGPLTFALLIIMLLIISIRRIVKKTQKHL